MSELPSSLSAQIVAEAKAARRSQKTYTCSVVSAYTTGNYITLSKKKRLEVNSFDLGPLIDSVGLDLGVDRLCQRSSDVGTVWGIWAFVDPVHERDSRSIAISGALRITCTSRLGRRCVEQLYCSDAARSRSASNRREDAILPNSSNGGHLRMHTQVVPVEARCSGRIIFNRRVLLSPINQIR